MQHQEILIGGTFLGGPCDSSLPKDVVTSPWDGSHVGAAPEGGPNEARAAVAAAAEAFPAWAATNPKTRRDLLLAAVERILAERERLAMLLVHEVGKPITWAHGEVDRLAVTFQVAADLLLFPIDLIDLRADPRAADYWCTLHRLPVGPVLAIVPYNWPYNLTAHKVAPALAAGCTLVVKPSPLAPLSTLFLCRLVHEAGLPPGVLNALPCPPRVAEAMACDERIAMVSFTGSPRVGWHLRGILGDKPLTLELGQNGFVLVAADADLEFAAQRIALGGYGYAGQVCISVQNVVVEAPLYGELRDRLIAATEATPFGDPADPTTVCGPLISSEAADRVMALLASAEDAGARILAGGNRIGNLVQPTLVEAVPPDHPLWAEEVFGPVVCLAEAESLAAAVAIANASRYGVQVGVFVRDPAQAEMAFRSLQVPTVILGDTPTVRFDSYPYGGTRESGIGREGVRAAYESMTTPRVRLERLP